MNNQIDTKSLESKLNEICKRCEYHLPFSDHTYDIVKALKRNKNKIFEGYFKKYKNNLAYFERYINKIAKDIFNNGRFNSSVLASSNKYLYKGELITASTKQEAIQKIVAMGEGSKSEVVASNRKNEQDYCDAIIKELSKTPVPFTPKNTKNSLVIKIGGIKGGIVIYLDDPNDGFNQLRLNYADIVNNGSDKEYIIDDVFNKTPTQVAKELKKVIVDLFNWYQLNQKIMYKYDMR